MRMVHWGLLFVVAASGCAPTQMELPPEHPPIPKDAVFFQEEAHHLFDRIVRMLEKGGYETETDRQHLFVQTRPKEVEAESGAIRFEGFFVVQVGPDRNGSFALIRFIVEPQIPGEREKLLKELHQKELHQ